MQHVDLEISMQGLLSRNGYARVTEYCKVLINFEPDAVSGLLKTLPARRHCCRTKLSATVYTGVWRIDIHDRREAGEPFSQAAGDSPILKASFNFVGEYRRSWLTAVRWQQVEKMDDKRSSRRRRVLKEARIVLNSGQSVINCTIRDQSENGARLRVAAATVLPKRFELLCLSEQLLRPAEIAWHHGINLGVTFVGQPRRPPLRKW